MIDDALHAYTESLVTFGRADQLSGVLTRASARDGKTVPVPPVVDGSSARLGVLLLNAGVIARSGPHRFNVKLARALARRDLPVLRFDLSGLGDSGVDPEALPRAKQVTDDIVRAIDVLHSQAQVEQVLIVGLCSGANQGWTAALTDSRIAGLVMIDPFAYPTGKTLFHYHLRRIALRSPAENLTLLGRALSRLPARAWQRLGVSRSSAVLPGAGSTPGAAPDDDGMPLAPADYASGMQALVDRGVGVWLVYTGTWSRHYSYAGQFQDRFGAYPFSRQVTCEYVPQFDHTFTLVKMQQSMIRRLESWAELWVAQRLLMLDEARRRASRDPAAMLLPLAADK